MTEKEWMGQVLELARLGRWSVYHTFDSRRSAAGFPDLTLLRPPELVMVELKVRAAVTAEQRVWLDGLAACGVECHVWRPDDLKAVMERLLQRRI